MALTTDQIINSSDILDTVVKQLYLVLFKTNDYYRENAIIFSTDVSERLDDASGTIKGRMLNALMKQIDSLGTGVVEIRGDKDAVWWSQYKERNDLITEALHVLYDTASEGLYLNPNVDVLDVSNGIYGSIAVGERKLCGKCNKFMCDGIC